MGGYTHHPSRGTGSIDASARATSRATAIRRQRRSDSMKVQTIEELGTSSAVTKVNGESTCLNDVLNRAHALRAACSLSRYRPLSHGPPPSRQWPRDLLRGERQSEREAGRVPSRRSGRRNRAEAPTLLRSEGLSDRALGSTRLWSFDALASLENNTTVGSRLRYREGANASRDRTLAAFRRLVGQYLGTRFAETHPNRVTGSCSAVSSFCARRRSVSSTKTERAGSSPTPGATTLRARPEGEWRSPASPLKATDRGRSPRSARPPPKSGASGKVERAVSFQTPT